uniref:PilZ domain-containing protein n=1 Tax=Parerythrobacter lutipelagi TaxID=1964208 RepID=UPI0010F9B999|nr:PilZ domain-containing protein [Parerythrobacter lutipelagi]
MDQRKKARAKVDYATRCRAPAAPVDICLNDVSMSGCRGTFGSTPLYAGSTLKIDLVDGLVVPGEVVWVDGNEFGARFLIDEAEAAPSADKDNSAPEPGRA